MFNKIEFSKRLCELMKDNGDTVYTLAEAVHLSPGTISKYINGKLEPRRNTIEVIALYYKINLLIKKHLLVLLIQELDVLKKV